MADPASRQFTGSDNRDYLESIAASILSRHGIDFAAAQRAGGWTNALWIADKVVLRLSTNKGNKNLLREARLARFFPPDVGYPKIMNTGTTEGYAWALSQKLPGCRLGEVWARLSWREQAIALQGLWQRAQAVHAVPIGDIADIVPGKAWFNASDPGEAKESLSRLTQAGIFTQSESDVLEDSLARYWKALPFAPCVLCHGDLTKDNAIWHAGEVIALLDFEFAVLAPVQPDLNHLVKMAFGPDDTITSIADTYQLRHAVKELALPILGHPNSNALLPGYAILLELHLLEEWLAHPEGEGSLDQWDPLRRLRSLAYGEWGYLRPFSASS